MEIYWLTILEAEKSKSKEPLLMMAFLLCYNVMESVSWQKGRSGRGERERERKRERERERKRG
jgi:hypothetical protein